MYLAAGSALTLQLQQVSTYHASMQPINLQSLSTSNRCQLCCGQAQKALASGSVVLQAQSQRMYYTPIADSDQVKQLLGGDLWLSLFHRAHGIALLPESALAGTRLDQLPTTSWGQVQSTVSCYNQEDHNFIHF